MKRVTFDIPKADKTKPRRLVIYPQVADEISNAPLLRFIQETNNNGRNAVRVPSKKPLVSAAEYKIEHDKNSVIPIKHPSRCVIL
jgi:hypothetical protein